MILSPCPARRAWRGRLSPRHRGDGAVPDALSRDHEDAVAATASQDTALYISEREHDALGVPRAARRILEEGDAVVVQRRVVFTPADFQLSVRTLPY